MEVNKEIVEKLKEEIRRIEDEHKASFQRYYDCLDKAGTAEEVVLAERGLLLRLLRCLPLSYSTSYFCRANAGECKSCAYGAVHGECRREWTDYAIISKLRSLLEDAIGHLYYKDENYEEERS